MFKTIPIKAKFTDEENAFWVDQCEHANSLINCAIYHTRQTHYARLQEMGDAYTTYWRGDELAKVGRGILTVPHRYDMFRDLKRSFRTKLRSVSSEHGATSV